MTVASEIDRVDYTGNGATSSYSYTFRILSSNDILVITRDASGTETQLALTTDYTVTGVNVDGGGTVSLVNGPLANGYHLTIKRHLTLTQNTALKGQRQFFASSVEAAMDRLLMIEQASKDGIDRSLRIPETETGAGYTLTLPIASLRANNALVFDGSGNLTVSPITSVAGLTAGQLLFGGSNGLISQSASLTWDNTNFLLKLGSASSTNTPYVSLNNAQGEQVRLTQRLAGDNLVNNLTTGGDVRVMNPSTGAQFDLTFYTFGASLDFNTNPNTPGNGSLFEFHGWQQSSLHSGAYLPTAILSVFTGSDSLHEIHVRPVADNDGIVLNYPTGGVPVIYTDTVSGTSTRLDFGCFRTRMFSIQQDGPPETTDYFRFTGGATNKTIILSLDDNQFSATKGQLLYAGGNATNNKYFGLYNAAADYLLLASQVTVWQDGSRSTEYARFASGGSLGIGTATPRKHVDILDTNNTHLRLTYTDNSVFTDFYTNSSGQLFIKPSGNLVVFQGTSMTTYLTGAATNQTIGHQFLDNAATLKGQLIYAGANGGGSKYFGLLNEAADYLVLGSDTISLRNLTGFTEVFGATFPASVINISFFGAAKVPKQTASGASGYADSGATVVHSAGTFTGGIGSTGYTIGDVVAALKNYGLLTS